MNKITVAHLAENHNARLLRVIKELEQEYPGTQLGVGGSWSSPKIDISFDGMDIGESYLLSPIHNVGHFIVKHAAGLVFGTESIDGPERWRSFNIHFWANIMRNGDKMDRHHHVESHLGGQNYLAAIYYVDWNGGALKLYPRKDDARTLKQELFSAHQKGWLNGGVERRSDGNYRFSIAPRNGTLLIFPADLEHSVEPYHGDTERVSLAFNIKRVG